MLLNRFVAVDDRVTACASCDSCGRRDVGVMYMYHGTEVLFECHGCNPKGYFALLRRVEQAPMPMKSVMDYK